MSPTKEPGPRDSTVCSSPARLNRVYAILPSGPRLLRENGCTVAARADHRLLVSGLFVSFVVMPLKTAGFDSTWDRTGGWHSIAPA
jgi:hypothetical protein